MVKLYFVCVKTVHFRNAMPFSSMVIVYKATSPVYLCVVLRVCGIKFVDSFALDLRML